MKTIKSIETLKFQVVLKQMKNGSYRVASKMRKTNVANISQSTPDFFTASMIFDQHLISLEGH